jgi:hypothetical protein
MPIETTSGSARGRPALASTDGLPSARPPGRRLAHDPAIVAVLTYRASGFRLPAMPAAVAYGWRRDPRMPEGHLHAAR